MTSFSYRVYQPWEIPVDSQSNWTRRAGASVADVRLYTLSVEEKLANRMDTRADGRMHSWMGGQGQMGQKEKF